MRSSDKNRIPISRRQFTAGLGVGFGAHWLALTSLLAEETAPERVLDGLHHPATARSVIFLFMSGGPSQVDTFDPKPELKKLAGQDVPASIAKHVPKIKRAGLRNLMASPWDFLPHGRCGMPISSLLPRTARHADQLCVIRSMTHRNPVHGPGECVALTGTATGDRPSLGAWSIYGLGNATDQLPSFIAMNLHTDGMQYPQAAGWGTGFLPSRYQGTIVDPATGIPHLRMPAGVTADQRRSELSVIQKLNRRFADSVGNPTELDARIRSYEMAFQMQTAAPELFNIDDETAETHKLYGLDSEKTGSVGRACLIARRMVQRGVRFIQLRVGGWDAHGNIKANHEKMAARTDQPIAALIEDLRRHGLLDSTVIFWGGEFGRTPTMEGRANGRDHSPTAYSVWLAGGGVRGGQIVGQTDPVGYTVVDRPVKPQDLHATILYTLGIDSERLVYDHHGLEETPLGVTGGAPVYEALKSV